MFLNRLAHEITEAVEEVLRRRLADKNIASSSIPHAGPAPLEIEAMRRTDLARAIYRSRRDRDAVFGVMGAHFGEPAWDILLDLYRARQERGHVSVSSACIASSVPPTTGLRHLVALEKCGLVERDYDPFDKRRCFVSLSATGMSIMDSWFERLAGAKRLDEFFARPNDQTLVR